MCGTEGRVVSFAVVKSDGRVGDGHVDVEGTEAALRRSWDHGGSSCLHVRLKGHLEAG